MRRPTPRSGWRAPAVRSRFFRVRAPSTCATRLGNGLEISGDGAIVRFGLGDGDDKPVLFDVAAGSLANSPGAPAGLAPARVDGLPVTDWKDSYAPKFKGVKIGLENYEMARSLAVRPDRSGFALGTRWYVRAFDAAGKPIMETGEIRARPGASTSARTAKSSSSPMTTARSAGCAGRTARSCSRCSSTFRPAAGSPGRRPAITWPRPGGEDLIGWHLNRGWAQEADFFPASRFSARFNRPDIVQLVLKTHDEAAAVESGEREGQAQAGDRADRGDAAAGRHDRLADGRRQVQRRYRRCDVQRALAVRPADRSRRRADRRPPGRGARGRAGGFADRRLLGRDAPSDDPGAGA